MKTIVANKVIPTVGSKVAGPLGAVHLPRLWAKLLLSSRGLLPDDYDACGEGFDAMTISALGLNRDELISFIRNEQPTYMALETWVTHKTRGALDAAKIDAHNRAILSYKHNEATAKTMRASSGVSDSSISDAATLNTLDDFDQLHAQLTSHAR
ncbi:MAG: hypothetical protein NVS3B16_05490 [Vulcanimicrobiaceae bacterium]